MSQQTPYSRLTLMTVVIGLMSLIPAAAYAVAPAAPTNVTVGSSRYVNVPVSVSGTSYQALSVLVRWEDNSFDEDRFLIQARVGSSGTWTSIAVVNANQRHAEFFFPNPAISGTVFFRVQALRLTTPIQTGTSVETSTVIPASGESSFGAPTSLSVSNVSSDDGTLLMEWLDNSKTEERYLLEYKLSSAADTTYQAFDAFEYASSQLTSPWGSGAVAFDFNKINARHGLKPGSSYTFRVRGVRKSALSGGAPSYTNFSEATAYATSGSVTIPALLPPSNFTVTEVSENTVRLKWTDNSNNEGDFNYGTGASQHGGYGVMWKIADVNSDNFFQQYLLGSVERNSATGLRAGEQVVQTIPGLQFDWRLKAIHRDGPEATYTLSESAETVSVTFKTNFKAPTHLTYVKNTKTTADVIWEDNSAVESGYVVQAKQGSGAYSTVATVSSNVTRAAITLPPGAASTVRVLAMNNAYGIESFSDPSNEVIITADNAIVGRAWHPAVKGTAFTSPSAHMLTTGAVPARLSLTQTGLPATVSLDPNTGAFSGVFNDSGVFVSTVTATFSDGSSDTKVVTFRVAEPEAAPASTGVATSLTIPLSTVSVPLYEILKDADSPSAVRVTTNVPSGGGNFDIILQDDLTPQTVANFMAYVNAGDYNGVAIHRAVPGFVVQMGGYKPTATVSPDNNFTEVTRRPSPLNEPGISNLRRTVAMAKQGGLPNSATHDFFVSLADNSANLDEQNEGFTVFGRVATGQMSVTDYLASTSIVQESVNIKLPSGTSTATQQFDSWPLSSANELAAESNGVRPVDKNKIFKMNSVAAVPTMSFSDVGSNNPSVATATLIPGSGTNTARISITGLAEGSTSINVTATDLDGTVTIHNIGISVSASAVATAITTQPVSTTVQAGEAASLSVTAVGDSLAYHWRKDGKPISGGTNATLSLPNAQISDQGNYDVLVEGTGGVAVSNRVLLTVNASPVITKQPESATRFFRGTVTFSLEAAGSATLSYQWKKNGRSLSGATSSSLTLSPIAMSSGGNYTCTVSNGFGSIESNIATLTVQTTDQDNDGLTDDQELLRGTDLFDSDTDNDGYTDGVEIAGSSDPKSAQSTPANTVVVAAAERENILRNIAMQKVPSGLITDPLDSNTNKTVPAMWLATYELTNAQWAAILQHAKEKMGILTVVDESGVKKAKVRGNVVCNVPTHQQGDVGSLGLDEVKLSDDGTSFVVSRLAADYPVRSVTWWGAYLAAEALNDFFGYSSKTINTANSFNFAANGFYIPRDHEWEWVARGGLAPSAANLFPTGSSINGSKANYDISGIAKPRPVRSYLPSKLGCYQLAGNVAEWVFDEDASTSGNSYTRGGGYDDPVSDVTNGNRRSLAKSTTDPAVGVRLALLDPSGPVINDSSIPDHKLAVTGTALKLDTTATGAPPIAWTWFKNRAVVKGQTSPSLNIPSVKLSDAGKYQLKARNGNNLVGVAGKLFDVAVVERVDSVVTKAYNGTVTLTAKTAGPGLTYQWRKGDVDLVEGRNGAAYYSGVTSPKLKITDVNAGGTANYSCLVKGPGTNNSALTGVMSVLFLDAPILLGSLSGSVTDSATPQIVGRTIAFAPDYNSLIYLTPTKFVITGLPKGLFYNPSTGLIFGRPLVSGEFKITVVASNAKGSSGAFKFDLIIQPFPLGAVGDYVGSIEPDVDVNSNLGGWFKLNVTAAGSYSGSLSVEGSTHSISGVLEPQTSSSTALVNAGIDIPRAGKSTLRFGFQINPVTNRLVAALGTFATPATSPEFYVDGAGWRNIWSSGSAFGYEGKQNIHLSIPSGEINNKAVPQGESYAVISITNKGVTNLAGRAADGTSINFSGVLGPLGEVLLYHAPYGPKGSMYGTLTVANTSEQRVTGTARWTKLNLGASSTDRNYKDGFGPVTLTAEGGKYRAPTGGNLVVYFPTTSSPNGKITFSSLWLNTGGTALEGSLFSPFNISSSHAVTPVSPTSLLNMTILPASGLFSGKARIEHNAETREALFYGLFVPDATPATAGRGYGNMLLPSTTAPTSPYISSKIDVEKQP